IVNLSVTASNRETRAQLCSALAEGGIEKAAVMLRTDPNYRGETWSKLGSGEVSVDVAFGDAPDRYRVTALARYSAADARPLRITADLARRENAIRIVRWKEER